MNKQLFDTGWELTESHGMMAMMMAQWQPVTLPHDASIEKPRSGQHPTAAGGGFAWSGVITYRKKFHAPEAWQQSSVVLELEGVYMYAKVAVNGNVALVHPYGYTSFHVDLKPYLKFGAENEVTVVANNSAQPNSRWYSGTGMYRHAWLRVGGSTHIRPWGVFVTTPVVDAAASQVLVRTELANIAEAASAVVLRSTVKDAAGKTVAQAETPLNLAAHTETTASQSLTVANAQLWSVEAPNLYSLTSEVLANGQVLDAEQTTFGIRSIAIDAKNGFRLNGVPMKLKGGCVHHDNGLLGAASYDRAEERKIELMKSAGYNAMRCAHNPPSPAMLDACDRLGMLVIDETFDCWRMGKNPNDYHLVFEDWWQRDTESMVRRDRNHPSIFLWSIGNEVSERTGASDGYAWCQRQADYVRSLDDTRGVTSALPALFEEMKPEDMQGGIDSMFAFLGGAIRDPKNDRWGDATKPFAAHLEVVGYNYLLDRYDPDGANFPERVMCGTETFPHWAYRFWDATARLPYVIGDFVWTSIDYLGESGIGQVAYDGPMQFAAAYPYHLANCGDFDICGFKRPQSYFRDILWGVRTAPYIGVLDPQHHDADIRHNPWGWEPVLDSWDFPGQEGKLAWVDVYSADDEIELLVNGVSAGRKAAGKASQNKVRFEATYQPGEITAVAYSAGKEAARTTLKTAGAPAALRLTPDRAHLNAAYGDLSYVTVEVVDQNGQVVKHAEHQVTFEVSGAGSLAAVGTANPHSEELYVGNQRKAWQGRLMAVVRSADQTGEVVLKVAAAGMQAAEVKIKVG